MGWRRAAIVDRLLRPWVTAAAIGYLILNAWCLTSRSTAGMTPVLSFMYYTVLGNARSTGPTTSEFWGVYPKGTGWEVVPLEGDVPLPQNVVYIRYARRQTGIWTPIMETRDFTIRFQQFATGTQATTFTLADRMAIAASIHAQYPGALRTNTVAQAAAGGHIEQSILPLGVLNDVTVLAAIGIGLISLGWIPRAFRAKPDPTLCRHCGYNLTGLTKGRCPECGKLR